MFSFFANLYNFLKSILLLLVSIFLINIVEKCALPKLAENEIFPFENAKPSKLTYIQTYLPKEKIRSNFVRYGNYFLINEEAELYDYPLESDIIEKLGNKGSCELKWNKNISKTNSQVRITCNGFKEVKTNFLSNQFYRDSFNVRLTNNTEVNLNISSILFDDKNIYRNPHTEELDLKNYYYNESYIYSDKKCESEPYIGCERMQVFIVDFQNDLFTVIGQYQDKKILPFYYNGEPRTIFTKLKADEFLKKKQNMENIELWLSRLVLFGVVLFSLLQILSFINKHLLSRELFENPILKYLVLSALSIIIYLIVYINVISIK